MSEKQTIEQIVRDYISQERKHKFSLENPHLSLGEKSRLKSIILPNGKIFLLPYDQAVEHSTYDQLVYPPSIHPTYVLKLAKEMCLSGVVLHPGAAEKYMHDFAGEVPLVLKLNGKSDIPESADPISSPMASVEKAVKLDAKAVGWTFYFGSPIQKEVIRETAEVIEEAQKAGMPTIIWAYPRGSAVDAKGGRDSLAMIAGAVKAANDMGATIIKANYPDPFLPEKKDTYHKTYTELPFGAEDGIQWIVKGCAGPSGLIVSGGSKLSGKDLYAKVEATMKAQGDGVVIGRNIFQNPYKEAKARIKKIMEILDKYSTTGTRVND